ncbi:hypothetical protein K2Q16_03290 [Patescibacteria group bacterium]|nr:hypothetical protein [Patescibacteria group bacterium]
MPIVALFIVLAAVIGGIVYFRDAGTTVSEVSTPTSEAAAPGAPLSTTTTTSNVPITAPATDTTPNARPGITPTPSNEVTAPAPEVVTIFKPYRSPARVQESITVNFTVEDGIVTAISSSYNEGKGENTHQKRFDGAYQTLVVGKKLSDISLSRVGGASLTSAAFNEAVQDAIAKTAS